MPCAKGRAEPLKKEEIGTCQPVDLAYVALIGPFSLYPLLSIYK